MIASPHWIIAASIPLIHAWGRLASSLGISIETLNYLELMTDYRRWFFYLATAAMTPVWWFFGRFVVFPDLEPKARRRKCLLWTGISLLANLGWSMAYPIDAF